MPRPPEPCTLCGTLYQPRGVSKYCLPCRAERHATYHARHKSDPLYLERRKQAHAEWAAAHRERLRAYDQSYRQAHLAHANERAREYYAAESEQQRNNRKAVARLYHQQHPGQQWLRLTPEQRARYKLSARRYVDANRAELNRRRRHAYAVSPEVRQRRKELAMRYDARRKGAAIGPVSFIAIMARDRMRCGLCGKPVKESELSFDHIIPLSAGGPHTEHNLQIAHLRCNLRKGARGTLPSQARLAL